MNTFVFYVSKYRTFNKLRDVEALWQLMVETEQVKCSAGSRSSYMNVIERGPAGRGVGFLSDPENK